MRQCRILLIITFLMCLSGCATKPITSSHEPNALIPLEIGNTWIFKEPGSDHIQKAEVIRAEIADGVKWHLYNEFGDKFWIRNDNGYQYEAVNAYDKVLLPSTVQSEIVFYPPGIAPNKYQSSGGEITYRACSKPISVPAGTFSCHIYRVALGDGNYSVNYYAPGVGLVRNEYTIDGLTVIYELSEYSIR